MSEVKSSSTSQPAKETTRRKALKNLSLALGGLVGGAALAATHANQTAQAATVSYGTPGISMLSLAPSAFVYGTPSADTKIGMLVTTASLAKLTDYSLDYFGCLPSWEAAQGIGLVAHGKRPIYALTGQEDYSTGIQVLARGVGSSGLVVTANKNDTQTDANQYVTGLLVTANSGYGTGLSATASGKNAAGIYAYASGENAVSARLAGNVVITGNLSKAGGTFRIDHPLDPENKFLLHSFVESPTRLNIYDGMAQLDERGEAVVELPAYFEALNTNYRYQLTALGSAAPSLHIAEEVKANRFKIAGGKAGQKVSWQVTGHRQDKWAQTNPLVVEEEKLDEERGFYLHPEAYGQPPSKGIEHARAAHKSKTLAGLPKLPQPIAK